MNKILALSVVGLLVGCAADLPTHLQDVVSPFDNRREVSVSSGFVKEGDGALSGAAFKLGAAWFEKSPGTLLIDAEVLALTNLARFEGLQFNIDGVTTKLSSADVLTAHHVDGIYSTSTRQYSADIALLDKLIDARTVKVKLVTDKGYRVGDLKVDGAHTAIRGLKKLRDALAKAR